VQKAWINYPKGLIPFLYLSFCGGYINKNTQESLLVVTYDKYNKYHAKARPHKGIPLQVSKHF